MEGAWMNQGGICFCKSYFNEGETIIEEYKGLCLIVSTNIVLMPKTYIQSNSYVDSIIQSASADLLYF